MFGTIKAGFFVGMVVPWMGWRYLTICSVAVPGSTGAAGSSQGPQDVHSLKDRIKIKAVYTKFQ
jgi:hypothetical protein